MKKEKAKKIFNSFIEATDQTFVQANEFSVIFYFYIAFSYILLFTSPTLFFQLTEFRISIEIIHGIVTASFLLCTTFVYNKKPLYWINTLVLILRYVGLFDVSAQWHDVFNSLAIVLFLLYYFIVIAILFAKRINEEGGPLDTALLAVGVFFILLGTFLYFEYKWMFIIGGGCCYLYALARVFKNVFYGKNNKELRLIQIIGNIIFYVTMIVGLPFFLEYAGVDSKTIQNIIVPIYAAAIGGIMTLGGVAWTIKKSDKDRKEDDKKKYRPIVNLYKALKEESISGKFWDGSVFKGITNNPFEKSEDKNMAYKLYNLICLNTDFSQFYLSGIIINGALFYSNIKLYVDKNEYFGFDTDTIIYSKNEIKQFSLIIQDLLGNEYKFPTKLEVVGEDEKLIEIKDTGFACDINTEACDERF